MSKKALVVIDVQKYYTNEHTAGLAQKIADHLKNGSYDFVLFAKFVNHKKSHVYLRFGWQKMFASPEIDICDELLPFVKANTVFEKDTYSVFKSEQFTKFLTEHGIDELIFCGVDTDACVLASAYEAFDLGFKVSVLNDLTASHRGQQFREYGLAIINRNIQKP